MPEMKQLSGGTNLLNPLAILKQVPLELDMQVGELGCGGAGHFVLPAARLVGPQGKVYAVDILKTVLAAVQARADLENFHNIVYIWSNLEIVNGVKIADSSLDVACLINVLFQNKEKEKVVMEAARLLKPGGKLLVVEWKERGTMFGPPQEKRVHSAVLETLAAKLNLQKEKEFEAGTYHYGLVFVKK